jgi:hypothetical protein
VSPQRWKRQRAGKQNRSVKQAAVVSHGIHAAGCDLTPPDLRAKVTDCAEYAQRFRSRQT